MAGDAKDITLARVSQSLRTRRLLHSGFGIEQESMKVFRHSPWQLVPSVLAVLIGLPFLAGKSSSVWIGVAICVFGLVLFAYHGSAALRRRIELNDEGLSYFDWRGRLVFSVPWSEVQGIRLPLNDGNGESTPHRLYTSRGSVNVIMFGNLFELERQISMGAGRHRVDSPRSI
jgi:hypothetical protein